MVLLTNKLKEKAHKQYETYAEEQEQDIVAKFFNPCGDGTWYLMNKDPKSDYCWGIVKLMGNVEMGSFSLKELEDLKLPFYLTIERDLHFEDINSSKLWKKLNNGKHV